MSSALREFARRIPKAELHIHLEGSIRPDVLLTLARRNGQPLGELTEAQLLDYYQFRDFSHFLEVYISILKCLRSPDDFSLIAYEFGKSMAAQNCRYAEVTFTIISNMHYAGLPWEVILAGLNEGRAGGGRFRCWLGLDFRHCARPAGPAGRSRGDLAGRP